MKLYQKHPKPLSQEPSPKMVELISGYSIPDLPIVDVACGYGRNGAYFANQGFSVSFIDMDQDCLDFISKGKGVSESGDITTDRIITTNIDVTCKWPFPPNSLGGVICIHFYYPGIIQKWLNSIVKCGFFYFETIDARSTNALFLPFENEIRQELSTDFNLHYYKERTVNNSVYKGRVSCVAFATKK